jgi:hypothetical protein
MYCAICLEHYGNYTVPRLLPCGHTFCSFCLKELLESQDKFFPCPLCQTSIPIPESNKDGFPKNFALIDVLERISEDNEELREIKAELKLLRESAVFVSSSTTSSTLSSSRYGEKSTSEKESPTRIELKRVQEEIEAIKKRSPALPSSPLSTSFSNSLSPSTRPFISISKEEQLKEMKREIIHLRSLLTNSPQPNSHTRLCSSTNSGIDLCILFDATESMEPWIQKVHCNILQLFERAQQLAQSTNVRIAFLAYRDHSDAVRFESMDFKSTARCLLLMKEALSRVVASGGDDVPEDIAGAFNLCKSFSWQSPTRLIYHIADAPCHGRRYNNLRDKYLDGDPYGINPELLMKHFAQNRIHYVFMKLNTSTDKMLFHFRRAYESVDGFVGFHVIENLSGDLGQLIPTMYSSIASSIRRRVTS